MLEIVFIVVSIGLLWFLYIYRKDRFEPEPWGKILKAVGWGAIPAILITGLINTFVENWAGLLVAGLVSAPLGEEAVKGIYVYRMRKDPELEGPMDGLVYGAAVGIGFEIVENILYSFSTEFGLEIAVVRSISVGHILFTGLFGLMVGMAKTKGKRLLIAYGYIGAVLMHFVWNSFIDLHFAFYIILFLGYILILKQIAGVAWKYELEAYISPLDEMKEKALRFITEHDGASTGAVADELGIAPHRTALFMKSIGARFDRGEKKWFLVAAEQS